MFKIRRAVWGLAILLPVASAQAGDFSTLEPLGFSADGSVFAFEEYGIQDGSGFPYANRFYIDTAKDDFVPGGSMRIRSDNEDTELDAIRAQAKAKGELIIPDATLAATPGYIAGVNTVTELSADPHRIVVYPRPFLPTPDTPIEFRIEEVQMTPPQNCEGVGDISGFRLIRIDAAPGGQTSLIHEDTAVPASRNCPQGYRIGQVLTYHPEFGEPVFAVMIAVRSMGFEGPDYRWIAVTGKL